MKCRKRFTPSRRRLACRAVRPSPARMSAHSLALSSLSSGPCFRPLRRVAHEPKTDRRHFFVQDAVNSGAVTVPHVESDKNLADILTKIYDSAPLFERMSSKLRSWVMRC